MQSMFIVVPGADVDSCRLQMRRDHRNVTERSHFFLKAKAENEIREIRIIASVKYGVIVSAPVHLHNIIDIHLKAALCKSSCAVAPCFFILAKQHIPFCPTKKTLRFARVIAV